MNDNKTINMRVKTSRKLYYDNETMWGVFSFKPITNMDKVNIDPRFGTFVVNGNSPLLKEGSEYEIEIIPSHNKKYGDGYTFVAVHMPRPTTIKEQQEYVETLLTKRQYNTIINAYPNEPILDMIEKGEIDCSRLSGIKETTLEKIRVKLFTDMEVNQILVKLKDLELTPNAAKKLLEYFTNAQTVIDISKENIYLFCRVDGFGFKTIDKYALNRGDSSTSVHRIRAGIEYALEQDAKNGNSWMSRPDLLKESVELLGINEGYILDFIASLDENKEGERDDHIYVDNNRIALLDNYDYEVSIYNIIQKMLERPVYTNIGNLESKINKIEEKNGFTYTPEQREAIKKSAENNVLVINGKAGSGKSTVLQGIVSVLDEYSYTSTALSGKAVQVLRDNHLTAQTIHMMLIKSGNLDKTVKNSLNYDIIIVDEASMVNNYLFYKILMAMNERSKLIIVGDNGQLPPIGTGAVFNDLIKYGDIPRQELTKVHRQAQKSGILSSANKIREGKQINTPDSEETEVFGELKDMVLIPVDRRTTDIQSMIIEIAKRNKDEDLFEFQVVVGRVDSGDISVKNLNIELQKVFNDISKPHVSRGGYNYRIGDKIIQNGNNYEARTVGFDGLPLNEDEETITEVFNGTLGKIVNIIFDEDTSKRDHKIHISFEDSNEIVEYSVNDLQQVGLAYALTVHKLQGSSANKLVFAFDSSSYMLMSKEFIYTGITRAKEACIMIADKQMLHMGIKRSHGGNRKTFLKDFLIENNI